MKKVPPTLDDEVRPPLGKRRIAPGLPKSSALAPDAERAHADNLRAKLARHADALAKAGESLGLDLAHRVKRRRAKAPSGADQK